VTKAIFAGKQVEEFSGKKRLAAFAFSYAVFPGFFKYFFLGYGPADAGCRQC
jgi:hypothetical protein